MLHFYTLQTQGATHGNSCWLILYYVKPHGPTCHKGDDTCWAEHNTELFGFLSYLEDIIEKRKNNSDTDKSYVASLFQKGINKIAQKVGEEAVETVIEAKDNNEDLFLNESASKQESGRAGRAGKGREGKQGRQGT